MLHTILVPLDGSPLSEQALPHACRLAQQTGAEIVLLRAASFPNDLRRPRSPQRVTVRDAAEYIGMMRHRVAAQGLRVRTEVLHSDAVHAIVFAARSQAVDLIVMSTHGYSGLRRMFLGSVAEAVLRQTKTPVFLVHASERPAPVPSGPYREVIVPLDGSSFAETALTYLLHTGVRPAHVLLLCATSGGAALLGGGIANPVESEQLNALLDQQQETARRYLDQVTEQYLGGVATSIELPVAGAAQAIADAAYGQDVEFIVMATHGRSGIDRLAHGSVARSVLHHAPVPVLVLHGDPSGALAPEAILVTGRSA